MRVRRRPHPERSRIRKEENHRKALIREEMLQREALVRLSGMSDGWGLWQSMMRESLTAYADELVSYRERLRVACDLGPTGFPWTSPRMLLCEWEKRHSKYFLVGGELPALRREPVLMVESYPLVGGADREQLLGAEDAASLICMAIRQDGEFLGALHAIEAASRELLHVR